MTVATKTLMREPPRSQLYALHDVSNHDRNLLELRDVQKSGHGALPGAARASAAGRLGPKPRPECCLSPHPIIPCVRDEYTRERQRGKCCRGIPGLGVLPSRRYSSR
jgi:hypothetical protein